jgi:lipid A 3-O-deacylase
VAAMLKISPRLLIAMLGVASSVFAQTPVVESPAAAPSGDPALRWEFNYESGALWRVGGRASRLDYVILPQLLAWKSPRVWQRAVGGRDLVLRSRYSVLLEPIVRGPENYFVGASASGILEWWNTARSQAFFFSSGGGIGVMDSKGYEIAGGQGQDFNLNWFIYAGSRFRHGENFSASFGVYFQHVSNGGMDEVNPGIDAVGPMLSAGWSF